MTFPELVTTERLILRRWRADDRDDFAAIWSDPDVWRLLRPGAPVDPDYFASRMDHHLQHWSEHGFGLWAVAMREGEEVAGWAGPAHPDFAPGLAAEVEVGWALRRAFWGRGLATEAAEAAVAASFAELEVERLISLIHAANVASLRVAGRLGMRRAGDATPMPVAAGPARRRAGEAAPDDLPLVLEVHELRRRDWRPGVGPGA
jgi:RimJ/RimL family protein N-acetyltransferase